MSSDGDAARHGMDSQGYTGCRRPGPPRPPARRGRVAGTNDGPGAPGAHFTMIAALQLPLARRRRHLEPQRAPAGRRLDLDVVGLAHRDRLPRRPGCARLGRKRGAVLGHRPPRHRAPWRRAATRPSASSGVMLMKPQPMRRAGGPDEARRRGPVQHHRRRRVVEAQASARSARRGRAPAGGRSPASKVAPGSTTSERAVEPRRELPVVVQVRVVDERAGARRREAHDERAARRDHRRAGAGRRRSSRARRRSSSRARCRASGSRWPRACGSRA